MNVEEALAIVDEILVEQPLSNLQEIIFCQSWLGKTYQEIAQKSGYDTNYIRDTGFRLWKLLSKEFEEKITKKNFCSVIRRYSQNYYSDNSIRSQTAKLPGNNLIANKILTNNYLLNRSSVNTSFIRVGSKIDNLEALWKDRIHAFPIEGREKELLSLKQWILNEHCQIVALVGIGGIGKTTLATKLLVELKNEFDYCIWISLSDTNSFEETITKLNLVISKNLNINLGTSAKIAISNLIDFLHKKRCLIFLDNVESILCSNKFVGRYKETHTKYSLLFRLIGEIRHQSCLVLVSREKPIEIALMEGEIFPVRVLRLSGLKELDCKAILEAKGLVVSDITLSEVVKLYAGNPLILKMISTIVKNLFDGNITNFLSCNVLIFGEVYNFLDRQFNRLSNIEKQILYWLTIIKEPIEVKNLQNNILTSMNKVKVLEALESLERRFFIENKVGGIIQNPLIMKYVTEYLVEQLVEEIITQRLDLFKKYSLSKTISENCFGETEACYILKLVIDRVIRKLEGKNNVKKELEEILLSMQENFGSKSGHAKENIISMINTLKYKITSKNETISEVSSEGAVRFLPHE